ncbi:MAG: GNAT family N-acetyltransferase [Proteobacteria bacterium]|nr:GNAT family N-acetyltransferase [Pseudomonadota bacterium]
MIIFLNGNSSSGKSVIARAMMQQSQRPFLYYSIDHLINFWIDEKFVVFEDEPKSWFFQQYANDIIETPSSQVFGPNIAQLRWDMIEAISVLINKGYDFIIDEMLLKQEIFQHYAKALVAGETVYLVKIFCELLESERREKMRQDRYLGLARLFYEKVYIEPPSYDLEIDSTYNDVDSCATAILEFVNTNPAPRAFLTYLKETISFKPFAIEHFTLMQQWLNAPHVNKWYGDRKWWSVKAVEKKYLSHIQGYQEIDGQRKPIRAFIICCAENPIGYLQLCNAHDFTSYPMGNLPVSLGALDLFIGEIDYLNKGLDIVSVINFLEQFVWSVFDNCLICPALKNKQAIETYQQAGFKVIQRLETPPVALMLKQKS